MKEAGLPLLLSLLGTTASATMERPVGGVERRIDNLENCQADLAGGGIAVMRSSDLFYFSPSFVERCAASLPMDVNNTLRHIYNLDGIFEQFYVFYYLAIDPENSEPMSYQPELGYTIAGEGEGKVNIRNRVVDLFRDVSDNQAANISTFWSLHAIYADLRDGHVRVPPIAGEFIVKWRLRMFPARTLEEKIYAKPEFTMTSKGDVGLTIHWKDPTGTEIRPSIVETVGGISVQEFLFYLANTRSVELDYQSVGARINQLVKIMSSKDYARYMFPLRFNTKPTDVMPDSLIVQYADGTEETYVTGVYSKGLLSIMGPTEDYPNVYDLVNRSFVELVINQPGRAYQLYIEARADVSAAVAETLDDTIVTTDIEKMSEDILKISAKATSKQQDLNYDFDFLWFTKKRRLVDGVEEYVSESVAGYKIEEDYAVLKIGNFRTTPKEFGYYWGNMTTAAKEKGVTKLIIDISGNGGGFGVNGLALAVSMFPHVEYKWFQNSLDATYNLPMDDYSVFVEPIVKTFEKFTEGLTNEDISEFIDNISEDQKVALNVTARALEKFCLQNTAEFCDGGICAFSCPILQQLTSEIENFLLFPTPPAYLDVWNQLYTVVRELNAWTTTLGGWRNVESGSEDYSYNTVVRGGVAYNVTSRRSLMSFEEYNAAAVKALQLRHSFDEYLIVSDGTAASTSSVFASAVEQIWKNRDRSGAEASVTTVSFGGTGDKADLTLAGIPAAVEDVRLDNALYTTISLLLFPMLLPVVMGNLNEWFDYLLDVTRVVDDDTYYPPYFAHQLPVIPVQNYYDPFMDPGALPLQYIKMQPDEYIRNFFIGTTFNDDYDLAYLYSEASAFFSQSTGTSTPLPTSTPSNVPTAGPTKNPTSSPSNMPTAGPTKNPTSSPSNVPTAGPTKNPTNSPSNVPTSSPTSNPTAAHVSGHTHPPFVSLVIPQPTPGGASNSTPDSQPNNEDSGVIDPLCEKNVAIADLDSDGKLDRGEFVTLVNLIAKVQIAFSFQGLPQAFQDMFGEWTSDALDIRSNIFHQGAVRLQTICSETTALVDALMAGTIPTQGPMAPASAVPTLQLEPTSVPSVYPSESATEPGIIDVPDLIGSDTSKSSKFVTPSTAPSSSETNEETAVSSIANQNLRQTISLTLLVSLTLAVCLVVILVLLNQLQSWQCSSESYKNT